MIIIIPLVSVFAFTASTRVVQQRAASRIAVTQHVFPLFAAPYSQRKPPSSNFLHKRRQVSTVLSVDAPRNTGDASPSDPMADIQQDLITRGGRVYMTNITLAGHEYTAVIDTGSSDTWFPSSTFQCINPTLQAIVAQKRCGFGPLYDAKDSPSFLQITSHPFTVRYSDGEFMTGTMGIEDLGIGGVDEDQLKVKQTIGVAETGWWMGDGLSSGLMGLAYPTLASNAEGLNYTSIIWTLFETGAVPPIFSPALSRPTVATYAPGGLLAIGGIPDIPHDREFASVPIDPVVASTYAFYSILVDGFAIAAPRATGPSLIPKRNYTAAPVSMVIDSGSSLMVFPDRIADYIASLFVPRAVYAGSSYLVPCSATAPRVGVIIAGKTFFVHEQDLMNKGPGAVRSGRGGLCTLAVLPARGSDLILGDSWLKGVLAVFDIGENEMRFAGRENS